MRASSGPCAEPTFQCTYNKTVLILRILLNFLPKLQFFYFKFHYEYFSIHYWIVKQQMARRYKMKFTSSYYTPIEIQEHQAAFDQIVQLNPKMMQLIRNAEQANPGLYVELTRSDKNSSATFVVGDEQSPSKIVINLNLQGDLQDIFVSIIFELCNATNPSVNAEAHVRNFSSMDNYATRMEEIECKTKQMFNDVISYGINHCGWPQEFKQEIFSDEEIKCYLEKSKTKSMLYNGFSHYENYQRKWAEYRLQVIDAYINEFEIFQANQSLIGEKKGLQLFLTKLDQSAEKFKRQFHSEQQLFAQSMVREEAKPPSFSLPKIFSGATEDTSHRRSNQQYANYSAADLQKDYERFVQEERNVLNQFKVELRAKNASDVPVSTSPPTSNDQSSYSNQRREVEEHYKQKLSQMTAEIDAKLAQQLSGIERKAHADKQAYLRKMGW